MTKGIKGVVMANVVLVVDMLRGFLEEGYSLSLGAGARGIIPNIQKLLERELAGGAKIFFICDNHDPDDLEFKMFPPHCVAGTVEAEVIPELARYPGEIIPKKRYSGFYLTNICVMHTTADARNRDYEVEIPVNCVASPDEAAHRFALGHM